MVAGISAGALIIARNASKSGVDTNQALDMVFWAVLGGLAGARVLHVLVEWRLYYNLCFDPDALFGLTLRCSDEAQCLGVQQCVEGVCSTPRDCLAALKFWRGGWVFLGGFLGGAISLLTYCRLVGRRFWPSVALLATGLPLAHAIGRVGCWVEGCCHGKATTAWYSYAGVVPTQLVEAFGNLLIFLLVGRAYKAYAMQESHGAGHESSGPGARAVVAVYMLSYGLMRFVVEVFRGDSDRGWVALFKTPNLSRALGFSGAEPLFLSTSQAIGLVMVLVGLWWLLRSKRS
jgi:phosphatidylglycerol:prolipoprotein diacylglycerol transferase